MLGNNRYYHNVSPDISSGFSILSAGFSQHTTFEMMPELLYRFQTKLVQEQGYTDASFVDDKSYNPILDTNISSLQLTFLSQINFYVIS